MSTDGPTVLSPAEVLERFNAIQDWKAFSAPLVGYALRLLSGRRWRGEQSVCSVPAGKEAEDLVADAVLGALTGKWKWDISEYPDLGQFLARVIKSQVANLVRSADNTATTRTTDATPDASDPNQDPRDAAADHEFEDRFLAVAFEEGDDQVVAVADCLLQGIHEPRQIAEKLGWEAFDVSQTKRKIARLMRRHFNYDSVMGFEGGPDHGE